MVLRSDISKNRFVTLVRYALAGCVLFGLLLALVNQCTIKHVEVEGAQVLLEIDRGKLPDNLLFFPTEHFRKLLLAEYPELTDIQFIKKFPSTLRIVITKRTPVARLESESRSVAIDEKGYIISETADESLPLLRIPVPGLSVGTRPKGKGLETSLAFIAGMSDDERIESITLRDELTLEVKLDQTIVLIHPEITGEATALSLQGLLKGFRMKGSLPSVLDLRFSKPVISF